MIQFCGVPDDHVAEDCAARDRAHERNERDLRQLEEREPRRRLAHDRKDDELVQHDRHEERAVERACAAVAAPQQLEVDVPATVRREEMMVECRV